jgi:hypothetical protein
LAYTDCMTRTINLTPSINGSIKHTQSSTYQLMVCFVPLRKHTESHRRLSFNNEALLFVPRIGWNQYRDCQGQLANYWILKQVVHIITNTLSMLNVSHSFFSLSSEFIIKYLHSYCTSTSCHFIFLRVQSVRMVDFIFLLNGLKLSDHVVPPCVIPYYESNSWQTTAYS